MSAPRYQPKNPGAYPRGDRDVVGIHWNGHELSVRVASPSPGLKDLNIVFPIHLARSFRGVDEGYRLIDIPIGDDLIYCALESPYLADFLRDASGTMDSMGLRHWVVVSCNMTVDILSEAEPSILEVK
jgi:hypothetical protein